MTDLGLSYDPDVNAAYLRLSGNPVAKTVEVEPDTVWADFDEADRLVGIEVIDTHGMRLDELLDKLRTAIKSLGSRKELLLA